MSDSDYIKIEDKEAYAEFEFYKGDNSGGPAAFLTVGWRTDDMNTERVITVSPEEALKIATVMLAFAQRELT